jgi:integrase
MPADSAPASPAREMRALNPLQALIAEYTNARRMAGRADVDREDAALRRLARACRWTRIEEADRASFRAHVADLHKARREWDGKSKGPDGKPPGITAARANVLLSMVSQLIEYANERREERGEPDLVNWAKAMPKYARTDSGDGRRPLWWDEAERLSAATLARVRPRRGRRGTGLRARQTWYRFAAYTLGYYTALRASRLRSLEVQHIVLDSSPRLEPPRGRGNKRVARIVPLQPEVVPIVRALIRRAVNGKLFPAKMFPSPRAMKRDCEAAGVSAQDVGMHSLRKCFACRCFDLGMELADVAALMGHSSTSVTFKHYTYWRHGTLARKMAGFGGKGLPSVGGAETRTDLRNAPDVQNVVRNAGENLDDAPSAGQSSDAVIASRMIATPQTTQDTRPRRGISAIGRGNSTRGGASSSAQTDRPHSAGRGLEGPPVGFEPTTCGLQICWSNGVVMTLRGSPQSVVETLMAMRLVEETTRVQLPQARPA